MVFDAHVVCARSLLLATSDTDLSKAFTIWSAKNYRLKPGFSIVSILQTNRSRISGSEASRASTVIIGQVIEYSGRTQKRNEFHLFRHLPWNLEVMHNLDHKSDMKLLSMLQK